MFKNLFHLVYKKQGVRHYWNRFALARIESISLKREMVKSFAVFSRCAGKELTPQPAAISFCFSLRCAMDQPLGKFNSVGVEEAPTL